MRARPWCAAVLATVLLAPSHAAENADATLPRLRRSAAEVGRRTSTTSRATSSNRRGPWPRAASPRSSSATSPTTQPALYPGVKAATQAPRHPRPASRPATTTWMPAPNPMRRRCAASRKAFGADTYLRKFDVGERHRARRRDRATGQDAGLCGWLARGAVQTDRGLAARSAARQAADPGGAHSVLRQLAGGGLGELPFRRSQAPVRVAASPSRTCCC